MRAVNTPRIVSRCAAAIAAWGIAASPTACEPSGPPGWKVTLRASSDIGKPLSGVQFHRSSRRLGATGASGAIDVELPGRDGETADIMATCPPGFRPLREPIHVKLRAFRGVEQGHGHLEHRVTCRPERRNVVVVVQAPGAKTLPVLVDGERRGTTDADGIAHVFFQAEPSSMVRVAVDTSSEPELRPQNPSRPFQIADEDEVFVFATRLSRPAAKPLRRAVPPRPIPYRLH